MLFKNVITEHVIHIINTLFHITVRISPRQISSLGSLVLGMIFDFRADTGCDIEKGKYYSLFIKTLSKYQGTTETNLM